MSLALDAEPHWLQGASTPGNTEEAQGELVQSREACRRPEHLPEEAHRQEHQGWEIGKKDRSR